MGRLPVCRTCRNPTRDRPGRGMRDLAERTADPDRSSGSTSADHAVAEGIAERVRARAGRRGGWIEVRGLMSRFGIERLSKDAKQRMTTALEDAGLALQPALDGLGRRDTVVLSAAAHDAQTSPVARGGARHGPYRPDRRGGPANWSHHPGRPFCNERRGPLVRHRRPVKGARRRAA